MRAPACLAAAAAARAAAAAYTVDDSAGLGLRWEGVGAISGGGATTKLLMDYPEKQRGEVLDFLFKPNYGLNLQILKVEVGGDTDATEGAEPSHMHSSGDESYRRGYEWWLMKEAKRRNPGIKLYGLPWGWPGWLDPAGTPDKQAKNPFANASLTANYTLAWLLGAKREHGLTIDYIGQWNERDAPAEYAAALRAAVAGSAPLAGTTVLDRLPHYPGTTDAPDPQGCKQYAWNTTDGSRWVDEEGSTFDGRSARCLARCVNRGYVSGCNTATIQWHLVSSFYDYMLYARCGVAVANQPWSGSYEITSPTWALAHTTQFAPIGWRYAAHGSGVTMLDKGGSMVTRVSPDAADLSIVIEKMSSANSACARGSNPRGAPAEEEVTVRLAGSFAGVSTLQVWYSDLTSGNGLGVNPPDSQLFQKRGPLAVGADGTVTLTVRPEEMYTLTTLTTGGKGVSASPAAAPFPVPWNQTFDDEVVGAPPKIWYDQMGAWEVQKSPYADRPGNVMRQLAPVWPACWLDVPLLYCVGPTTYFGPEDGGLTGNLTVSFDLRLEDDAVLTFNTGSSIPFVPSAELVLDTAGKWKYGGGSGTLDFATDAWHTVSVALPHGALTVDGTVLRGAAAGRDAPLHAPGRGWRIKMSLSRYVFASIDNFLIAPTA